MSQKDDKGFIQVEEDLEKTKMEIDPSLTETNSHPSDTFQEDVDRRILSPLNKKDFTSLNVILQNLISKLKTIRIKFPSFSKRNSVSFHWIFNLEDQLPLLLGIVALFFLGKGAYSSWKTSSVYPFIPALVFLGTSVFYVGGMIKRKTMGVLTPFVALAGLFFLQLHYFKGTIFFTLGRHPLEYFFNTLFLTLGLLVLALFIWCVGRLRPFLRLLVLIVGGYGLLGPLTNLFYHLPLQASWMGSGFLTKIPLPQAQPIFILLLVFFPLCFLLSWVGFRNLKNRTLLFTLILLSVLSGALGIDILIDNRVPLGALSIKPLGYGEIEKESAGSRLKIATQMGSQGPDQTDIYFFKIEKFSTKQGLSFDLKVKDQSQMPVFFLNEKNLILSIDGVQKNGLKLKFLGVSREPVLKNKEVFWGRYRLQWKGDFPPQPEPAKIVDQKNQVKPGVMSPQEGDSFGDSLWVEMATYPGESPVFELTLDDGVWGNLSGEPYGISLNTQSLAAGPHTLKIYEGSQSLGKPPLKEIKLNKGDVPNFAFISPLLGQYVNRLISLEIGADPAIINAKILKDGLLDQTLEPPFKEEIDTKDWENWVEGPHWITAIGQTADGKQVSQTLKVYPGYGDLSIEPSEANTNQASNVFFILDASSSMGANWGESQRLGWLMDQLDGLQREPQWSQTAQIGYVLAHGACEEKKLETQTTKIDALTDRLNKASPSGLFNWSAALEIALKNNPQKIIMVTDGLEDCPLNASVMKKWQSDTATLDVVSFNALNEKERNKILSLGQEDRIRFFALEKEENVFGNILLHYFVLKQNGETLLQGLVEPKVFRLRSGNYDFQVIKKDPSPSQPLSLNNGVVTPLVP